MIYRHPLIFHAYSLTSLKYTGYGNIFIPCLLQIWLWPNVYILSCCHWSISTWEACARPHSAVGWAKIQRQFWNEEDYLKSKGGRLASTHQCFEWNHWASPNWQCNLPSQGCSDAHWSNEIQEIIPWEGRVLWVPEWATLRLQGKEIGCLCLLVRDPEGFLAQSIASESPSHRKVSFSGRLLTDILRSSVILSVVIEPKQEAF